MCQRDVWPTEVLFNPLVPVGASVGRSVGLGPTQSFPIHKQQTTIERQPIECAPEASSGLWWKGVGGDDGGVPRGDTS